MYAYGPQLGFEDRAASFGASLRKNPMDMHYSVAGRDLLDGAADRDLLARRRWLLRNVAIESFSLKQMPVFSPPIMRQEWAIGTLSMTSAAMANLVFLYPETRQESKDAIAKMIERMLRDDLASYENYWWGESAFLP